MATRAYYGKAVTGNAYKNDGATVVGGGNVPSTAPVTNVPTTAQVLGYSGRRAPVVASGDYAGAHWVTYGADFAKMTEGRYVMRRGGANTNFLAGNANTLLQSGGNAAGAHHSIHYRTTGSGIDMTAFNIMNGSGTFSLYSENYIVSGTGNDDAAVPTMAIPGELAYLVTGASPTQDEYAARTQW